jgi:hypothetical protein
MVAQVTALHVEFHHLIVTHAQVHSYQRMVNVYQTVHPTTLYRSNSVISVTVNV